MKNMKRTNKNLKRQIASLKAKGAAKADSSDSLDDDESVKTSGNRSNPALSRQKSKGKSNRK
jgi:hypothetical protein